MKSGFDLGLVREVEVVVTDEMCPAFDGVIVHRCYSTWSVAHHFELAARKILVDFLEPEEEGVGSHVSVDHLAPCRIGRTVRIRAKLTERTDRRVVCELEAFDGTRLLARGRQIQIVMSKKRLKEHLER